MRFLAILFTLVVLAEARRKPNGGSQTTTTQATVTTTVADGGSDNGSDVGPFGPTVAALTSTSDASANDYCGDDAMGYYEEYEANGYRYVIVSGAPNHAAEYDQENPNPNTRCEIWQYAALPLTWSDSGSQNTKLGTIGYVMSGTTVYDPRSSPFGDLASYNEWDSLDPSFGHSDQNKQYHYHAVPTEYSSAADSSACEHIGYMLDGAKLYGYCEIDGVAVSSCYQLNDGVSVATVESDYTYVNGNGCVLDECNMGTLNGESVYFMTPEWPYVPKCLKGSVADINGFTPDFRA